MAAEKNLRSRAIASIDREAVDSRVTRLSEGIDADGVQGTDQTEIGDTNGFTDKEAENQNRQVNMSAVQWQDILAAIKQVVQTEISKETGKLKIEISKGTEKLKEISKETEKLKAEISKETERQTAVLEARLTTVSESLDDKLNLVCEDLKVEMRAENEKVAASLRNNFKADSEKLRQEISLEIQTERNNRSKEIELIRKELKTSEQEANQKYGTWVREMNEHKINIEAAVKEIEQRVAQTREDVQSRVDGIASDVKNNSTAIVRDKKQIETEIQRVNAAISQIQAKSSSNATPHHSSLVRNECMSQDNCNSSGLPPSQSEQVQSMGVNGISACSVSACDESMMNVIGSVCTENVSAGSVVAPNGHNLEEFSLPKFKNSSKQLVTHFLRELDEYFVVRKTPVELKLPLCFKAIEDPFAKQWFTTIYKTIGTYEQFKTAITNLLWGQTRQAQIRCSIYQDRWDRRMNESYTEHYIRYASQASMLNPPLLEEDLAGAMVGHYPPDIQNGMISANLKTTQEAIAYLGNMQALEITRGEHMRRPRREYEDREIYNRSTRGRVNDSSNHEHREVHQTRNVRYVQSTRNNSGMRNRSPRNVGRNRESNGWGSGRRPEQPSFNPRAQEFEPRTHNWEGMTNPSGAGQETRRDEDLNN